MIIQLGSDDSRKQFWKDMWLEDGQAVAESDISTPHEGSTHLAHRQQMMQWFAVSTRQ